jgi:hypothetical protein
VAVLVRPDARHDGPGRRGAPGPHRGTGPVTEYIRYEYDVTAAHNIAAGEQVRWLPRRRASDLALPGNDFWLFDGVAVLFNHFAGNGDMLGEEYVTDPAVAELCATAFEAVWDRAVPHADYAPR